MVPHQAMNILCVLAISLGCTSSLFVDVAFVIRSECVSAITTCNSSLAEWYYLQDWWRKLQVLPVNHEELGWLQGSWNYKYDRLASHTLLVFRGEHDGGRGWGENRRIKFGMLSFIILLDGGLFVWKEKRIKVSSQTKRKIIEEVSAEAEKQFLMTYGKGCTGALKESGAQQGLFLVRPA